MGNGFKTWFISIWKRSRQTTLGTANASQMHENRTGISEKLKLFF